MDIKHMGFVNIIPIEETFFKVIEKPRKTRLSKLVIRFNYAHLSPFQKGDALFLQTAEQIYAWFLEKPLTSRNSIFIPEAYLIYRFFRIKQEAIILLPRNGILNILTIKKGTLASAISMKNVADLDSCLDLLRREHSLNNPEVIRLEAASRFPVKPADIFAFADFEIKPAELLGKIVNLAKIPIVVSLLITSAFTFYKEFSQEKMLEARRSYLQKLKKQNYGLQSSLEQVRGKSGRWQEFINNELVYPEFYLILSRLTGVVAKFNGYINSVDLSDDHITMWTGQKTSEATLIKELLSTGLFKEVRLISSIKDTGMPDYTLMHLEIILKPAKEGGQS